MSGYDAVYAHPEVRYTLTAWATACGIEEQCPEYAAVWKDKDFEGMRECRGAFERLRLAGRAFPNIGPLLPSQWIQADQTVNEFEREWAEFAAPVDAVSAACAPFVLPILTGYKSG